METKPICPSCQKTLPPDVPLGLCPECLVKAGFQTGTEADTANGPAPVPLPPPPTIDQIASLFPHLEILELLGRGGMGAVYKARQPKLDRFVALKILLRRRQDGTADTAFAERFAREARALARLNHQDIVAVYDYGEAGGYPFLVMEYVDGLTLRHLLQGGKLPPDQALAIVPKVCEALTFAHQHGVVHRDIKPENILLDKQGRVKIADFGIAKIVGAAAQSRLTQDQQTIGTPHYMAPEQIEHPQQVDHRADIYSLGVVFYEMLTGELPLGKFAPPSRKVEVDVRLDEVVLHALEKEPDRRYQEASQVKTDVETIAKSAEGSVKCEVRSARPEPAAAASPSGAEDVWRQVKGPGVGLVVTGILNWIAIPFWLFVAAAFQNDSARRVLLPALPLTVLILSAVMLAAGLKLRRLEAYPLAIIGSILAILVTPGNLVGLPIGIWALVVLTRREVRAAFAGRARGTFAAAPPQAAPTPGSGAWKVVAVVAAAVMLLLAIPVGAILFAIALPAWHRARTLHQTPEFVVRGTVTDAVTGRPIIGARVADNLYNAQANRAPQEAWTDSTGHYRLLTWYEEHTLAASASGYETKLATLITKPVGREQETQMDFQLQPTTTSGGGGGAVEVGAVGAVGGGGGGGFGGGEIASSVPPVVIQTIPKSGAADVDPGLTELQVTFSKPMKNGSWAWCYEREEDFPSKTGEPQYRADGRSSVLPVKLQPGKVYAVWINTEKFQGFQDQAGRPAVPYLLVFQTRK